MSPYGVIFYTVKGRLPRTRGDEPDCAGRFYRPEGSAPHTRG